MRIRPLLIILSRIPPQYPSEQFGSEIFFASCLSSFAAPPHFSILQTSFSMLSAMTSVLVIISLFLLQHGIVRNILSLFYSHSVWFFFISCSVFREKTLPFTPFYTSSFFVCQVRFRDIPVFYC